MFRTLFILCLVVFTTFAFPAENNDSSLGQDIETEPIVTVPAPIKKSISLQDVYEPCKTPFVTQNYNPNWEKDQGFNENSTLFYLPLFSKGEMYRIIEQLYKTKEFDEFKEEHLSKSCFRFVKDVTGNVLTMQGFNDLTAVLQLTPIGHNTFIYQPTYPGDYGGTVYTAYSDNKAFTILTTCHNDGLGSFAVLSPHKTLSPESLHTAKEILKAIGFKEEYFLEPNADLDCSSFPLTDLPVVKKYSPAPALLSQVPFPFGNFGNGIFGQVPISSNTNVGFNYPASTFFSSPSVAVSTSSHVAAPAQNRHFYRNYYYSY